MKSRTGRIALIIAGLAGIAAGGVWAAQGLNLIPGSFMTGDRTWLYVGVVVAVVGVILLVLGVRRPKDR